jgi:hypothetical protein
MYKFIKIFIVLLLILSSCKKGCTDSTAMNYNETVKKDNGTCIYKK